MHNEHKSSSGDSRVFSGKLASLDFDAGTPEYSIRSYLLVHVKHLPQEVAECLPGPTALIPALVQSGMFRRPIYFLRFFPL